MKFKNKRSSVFKWVALGAIAASALLAAGAASARGSWSVQIGAGGYPAPYYAPPPPAYYPAPIYYAPAPPVYYRPPPPVYYRPAPVYAPPPGRIYYGPGYPYRPPNGDEWDNDREYEDRD
ncbi:hypothetical protein EH244_17615 [Variovorax beijingensis]|uniref:PXPV repeat-containing protein n=1 Tax=Variovorax beijingensis TaxID=2496117 RepID=A0A3P3ELN0_9BURK|nr:hypothetical protein [Variovorax beijingensis]RRH87313.1 hypothetical protein EH244_17615 [Variovorax beijingensis]RSZ35603.1 hypothetical protein EJO66_16585 [Variovorax beijingensis]